jgi:hypothetical protein
MTHVIVYEQVIIHDENGGELYTFDMSPRSEQARKGLGK